MSREVADGLMNNKVASYQNFANKVTAPLSESQKKALTSFEYNLGKNIWDMSGKPIIDKINAGDFVGAAEYMKKFNRA
jgi:GH24 family phage-related lysozyme (muramidase)